MIITELFASTAAFMRNVSSHSCYARYQFFKISLLENCKIRERNKYGKDECMNLQLITYSCVQSIITR